jgi:hypothetical protein
VIAFELYPATDTNGHRVDLEHQRRNAMTDIAEKHMQCDGSFDGVESAGLRCAQAKRASIELEIATMLVLRKRPTDAT